MKTWAKIEDDLPFNQKVRAVKIPARWTYVSSICYAAHNLTDGYIPSNALTLIEGTPKIAKELVTAGLWESVQGGGWMIHDFLKHNRSRASAVSLSTKNSESGAKGGQNRWQNAKRNATEFESETPNETLLSYSLSLSTDPDHSEDLPQKREGDCGKTLSETPKPPRRYKSVDDEAFLDEQQAAHPSVNVRDVLARAKNRAVWDGYKDKRRALGEYIGWAEEKAAQSVRGGANGRTPTRGSREAEHADQLAYFRSVAVSD